MRFINKNLIAYSLLLSLAGCGGGSGSSQNNDAPSDSNHSPEILQGESIAVSVQQGNSAVVSLDAIDQDTGDSLTWSLDDSNSNFHGSSSISNSSGKSISLQYEPDIDYVGVDTVFVSVSDGKAIDQIRINLTVERSASVEQPVMDAIFDGGGDNNVALGPVAGANVVISTLDGIYNLYSTTTDDQSFYSVDEDVINSNIDVLLSERPEYVLISSTGGVDLDTDDDGVLDANGGTPVQGTVKGIIKLDSLLTENSLSINLISTALVSMLEVDNFITEDKISYLAKQIGVIDINHDGKIDNRDVYMYHMALNDSPAEELLRPNFLPSIHENNTSKATDAIQEALKNHDIIYFSATVNNEVASLELESNANIYYAVNAQNGGLLTDIYNQSITLNKHDYVLYKQCSSDSGSCGQVQLLSFDGQAIRIFSSRTSDSSIFSSPEEMNTLRASIVTKVDEIAGLEEQIEQEQGAIEDKQREIQVLQEKMTVEL